MTKRKITILDYGSGNIGSLVNIFRYIGADPRVVEQPDAIQNDMAIILPGVGHFAHAVNNLETTGFAGVLVDKVSAGVPLLGICVGMQLLFEKSEEGNAKGLGLLKGQVRCFDQAKMVKKLPLPNVGWRHAEPANDIGVSLLSNMPSRPKFYYVHSYHAQCSDPSDMIIASEYGYRFTGAVARDNVTGFQFHPEKSHVFGMTLLANWIERVDAE